MTRLLSLSLLVLVGSLSAREPAPTPEQVRFFESKVRPLFVKHCQECHGPKKQEAGLRLDSAAAFRAGGESGSPVAPGKPDDSLLIHAVRHEGPKMPPKKQLAADEIAVLVEWVRTGAAWPAETTTTRKGREITAEDRAFWAFQPVRDHSPPPVKNADWPLTPIDRFLLERLEAKGLSPVSPADRRTLIRRATFDLTGLPPKPEDIDAFVNDGKPRAFERVVERLLASPAYGERWGRHWLDVVRYADTAGDNSDYPIPQMYRYRNWVIDAVNADKPYDVFLREQIAGDLMPGGTEQETFDRIVATGYLANTRRFGSYEDKRYQWYLTFEDSIENLGRATLGLSLSCARCHDHKFDPIPSEDYYALYGFFQSTRYPWPGIELDKVPRDLVPLAPEQRFEQVKQERDARLKELDEGIKKLEAERAAAEKEQKAAPPEQMAEAKKKLDAATKQVQAVKKDREQLAKTALPVEMAYAVVEGKRWVGNAKMQMRGDPEKPGPEASRRFLSILGGQPLPSEEKGSGRLQLANWITDPKNPLTARVMVNRIWMHHFGRGLVPTPNDFGRQGRPPSHPELLDYLAARFVESGWSVKAMHRLILLSRAYQLSSDDLEANAKIDADNESLWHFPRRRLDAESIRDTLLSLSGLLDRSPGGPHPFPDQTTWNFTQHNPFKAVYETDRRSVYLMTQRIQRHPYLALFDGADTNASTAKRGTSTTPLQALYLMNDPLVHRLAKGFAARLQRERTDETARIEHSYLLAFGRPPTNDERGTATAFLGKMRSSLSQAGVNGKECEAQVWESYARALFLSNELVYVN